MAQPEEEEGCASCKDLNCDGSTLNLNQLLQSAEAKACRGCMLLVDALEKFDVYIPLRGCSFDMYPSDPTLLPNVYISGKQHPRVHVTGASDLCLEIYASPGTPPPLGHLTEATEILGDTGSERALAQIAKWLQHCTDTHKAGRGCPPNLEVPLPTRLLDVCLEGPGAVDSVRLVETSGMSGTYACLSHCWGPRPLIRTLRGNYEQHKAGIANSSLPKTFQDAVTVARSLGIQFLWVDSLCIIQDDLDDWQKEAALMARIYQNGRIIIMASNSTGADTGCFTNGPRFLSKELSIVDADGKQHHARAREAIDHGGWPILARGWVYQERMLSPRLVHFGHTELVFECLGDQPRCECSRAGIWDFQRFDFGRAVKQYEDFWTVSPDYWSGSLSGRHAWDNILRPIMWKNVVQAYSQLDLTFGQDIFPALSGVVKQFQRHRDSKYIAGLWEDTLVEDMLWESFMSEQPRSPEWQSPTWSWASLSGGRARQQYPGAGASYSCLNAQPRIEHVYATVDEVSVTPLGPDPTGQLSAAHVVLTGPTMAGQAHHPRGSNRVGNLSIVGYEDFREIHLSPLEAAHGKVVWQRLH